MNRGRAAEDLGELADRVRALLLGAGIGGLDTLRTDQPLISSGALDSLDVIRLVTLLEHEFTVSIDDDDLEPRHFDTCDSMAALLSRYV